MYRRCSFLISKALAKLYQKFCCVELRKERSKNAKTRMSVYILSLKKSEKKLKQTLKNTKCEGVKVHQLFTFFTSVITRNNQDFNGANVKLLNGGTLGLGTSTNVSGISNSLLQYCCDGSFFSILFRFSAIKGPVKELRLSFMSGEKYVNKIFLLLSGSESAKLSPN